MLITLEGGGPPPSRFVCFHLFVCNLLSNKSLQIGEICLHHKGVYIASVIMNCKFRYRNKMFRNKVCQPAIEWSITAASWSLVFSLFLSAVIQLKCPKEHIRRGLLSKQFFRYPIFIKILIFFSS